MSFYLEILVQQNAFAFAEDDNERIMFSFNLNAMARSPVDQFEEELARLINDAALGTKNVDVFIGPKANIPNGDGPYVVIIDTGGVDPLETQNADLYERLSAQITVRGKSYPTTRARAKAIQRTLDGVRNTTVAA